MGHRADHCPSRDFSLFEGASTRAAPALHDRAGGGEAVQGESDSGTSQHRHRVFVEGNSSLHRARSQVNEKGNTRPMGVNLSSLDGSKTGG